MKGRFEFKNGYIYHMPIHFRFLHSVIPGTVATPIWGGGEVPEGALRPEESARTILERVKENMRIVFVDPKDMEGAKTFNHPDLQPFIDEIFTGSPQPERRARWVCRPFWVLSATPVVVMRSMSSCRH